ncbi:Gfo/Idh/MocA family oxidoreductase [Alkalihalobacillus trypoxylicola]
MEKVVLVGCGGMANVWIDEALKREDVEVVALVDLYVETAKRFAEKKQVSIPIFSNLSEAIEETKPTIIFDVTIPASHKEVATTGLLAGLHVFGEKPMAESIQDAKELVHLTEKTENNYFIMQNRRYVKGVRAIEQYLKDGHLGKLGSVHTDFFIGPHFGGFRELMKNPLLVDMAIHTFDQARFMIGADPVAVYCHEFNPPGSWFQHPSSAICIFEMSDGTVFSYRGSWSAEGFETSWEADWRFVGTKGTLKWDGTSSPKAAIVRPSEEQVFLNESEVIEIPLNWKGREGHLGCLDEMFLALKENRKAETDCSDNIKSLAMVLSAVESAQKGEKVQISW